MSAMIHERVTITSRTSGTQREAILLSCPECKGHKFIVYLIEDGKGGYHPHLQCEGCYMTFCQGGDHCPP